MMEILELDKNEMRGYLPDLEIPKNYVIAGGSIRRWFLGEKQNSDFDYFKIGEFSEENYNLNIDGLQEKYSGIVQTTYDLNGTVIQVIKRKYANIENLFNGFDFHHCQFAYDGEKIYTTKKALISSMRRHLSFNRVVNGFELDTLRRAFKYCEQGFKPCAGTIGALGKMFQESDANLDEQLEMSPSGGKKSVIRFD